MDVCLLAARLPAPRRSLLAGIHACPRRVEPAAWICTYFGDVARRRFIHSAAAAATLTLLGRPVHPKDLRADQDFARSAVWTAEKCAAGGPALKCVIERREGLKPKR